MPHWKSLQVMQFLIPHLDMIVDGIIAQVIYAAMVRSMSFFGIW